MICTHCGKVLKDYDRFCSNCGAVIEQEEEKEFVFTAPERGFEWNVHSFPDGVPHKTEDIDFDWGIKEGEFKRGQEADETSFQTPKVAPVPGVEQMQEINADFASDFGMQQPAPKTEMNQQMQETPVQEFQQDTAAEGKAEMPSFVADVTPEVGEEKPKVKKGFFSRFMKDKTETAENLVITDEMIQSVSNVSSPEELVFTADQIQDAAPEYTSEPQVTKEEETIYKTEHVHFDWTQSMDPHHEFMAMVEKQERETADQMPQLSELKDEKEGDIKGEELEKELFGGAAVAGIVDGGEGLSRHSAKIDKFYTFNKKNEEFQKLLDNEYERFREGRPLDNDTFSANVEAIRTSAENKDGSEIRNRVRDGVSGLDEMEAINDTIRVEPFNEYEDNRRTMPYHIISIDDDIVQPEPENALTQDEQTATEPQQYPRQATMPQFAIDPEPEMVPGLERLPEMEKTQEEIDQEKLEKIKEIFRMEQQPQNVQEQMFYTGQPQSFQPQQAQNMTAQQSQSSQFQNTGTQPQSFQLRPTQMDQSQNMTQNSAVSDTAGQKSAGQEETHAKRESVFENENDKNAKSGKAGKIAIVVLSVILALLIIALGLKLIAPDSILSQRIDNIADSVMEFFTGENDTASSELIKEKNADNADGTAVYSAEITADKDNQETKTLTISV